MNYIVNYDAKYYFDIFFYFSTLLLLANSFFLIKKFQNLISYIVNSLFCLGLTVFTTYRSAIYVDEHNANGDPLWLYILFAEVIIIAIVIYIHNKIHDE